MCLAMRELPAEIAHSIIHRAHLALVLGTAFEIESMTIRNATDQRWYFILCLTR